MSSGHFSFVADAMPVFCREKTLCARPFSAGSWEQRFPQDEGFSTRVSRGLNKPARCEQARGQHLTADSRLIVYLHHGHEGRDPTISKRKRLELTAQSSMS